MNESLSKFVSAAAEGNVEAMGRVYSKTIRSSYYLASLLCGDSDKTIEIVKKAYARVFCTMSKIKKPEAFEIWMKQNIATVYKEGVKFIFEDADGSTPKNSMEFLPSDVLFDDTAALRVSAAIRNLKDEMRTAIVLQYNNGMPVQAIAKFLGVSSGTIDALLAKAKAEIVEVCGFETADVIGSDDLPVLTRLFRKCADEVIISPDDVRGVFTYAVEIFNSCKESEANAPETDNEDIEIVEETIAKEEPESKPEEKPAKPVIPGTVKPSIPGESKAVSPEATPEDDVLSFKNKINQLLEGNIETPDTSVAPQPAETPDFSGGDNYVALNVGGNEADEPAGPTAKDSKISLKSLLNSKNFRKLLVAAVALIVVIAACVGIGKAISSGKANKDSGKAADSGDYTFVEGGFENVTEINYLSESCCVYKYVANGKYGLMDYEGHLITGPDYEEFSRCSTGRDYSQRSSYHTLVKIGDEYYEFRVQGGQMILDEKPHGAHSVQPDALSADVSYEERDRYFNGYAAARKGDKWGYISKEKDKKVIPFEYEAVNELSSTEAQFCDYCRPVTSEGLVPVKKDGYMGIVNLKNDVVVPFEYSDIMCGSNGVFIAKKGGVWGVILTGDAITRFSGINLVFTTSPIDIGANTEVTKYRVVSDDSVNIRSDAGSEFDLLGELNPGDEIEVYSTKEAANGNLWACFKYNDGAAYISMNFLKKID